MADKSAHFTWSELKSEAIAHLTGAQVKVKDPKIMQLAADWRAGVQTRGTVGGAGATGDEMLTYLRRGYTPATVAIRENEFAPHEERKIVFAEEGELDLHLAYSGFDYPYLEWETPESLPGIRIRAEVGWAWTVPAKTITEYGAWIAGVMSALEKRGYDIDLALRATYSELSVERYGKSEWNLTVKRENELSSFTDWSALFAPGGYRILGFLTCAMACNSWGERMTSFIGYAQNRAYGVEWNSDTLTLTFRTSMIQKDFPREFMNSELARLGIL